MGIVQTKKEFEETLTPLLEPIAKLCQFYQLDHLMVELTDFPKRGGYVVEVSFHILEEKP